MVLLSVRSVRLPAGSPHAAAAGKASDAEHRRDANPGRGGTFDVTRRRHGAPPGARNLTQHKKCYSKQREAEYYRPIVTEDEIGVAECGRL